MDKLVTNRLVFQARSRGFMNPGQFGFTPCVGNEDALQKLRESIESCNNRDNDASLVMLKIKGAFNNSWWPSIFAALGKMRCPRNLFKLVKSFLSERKVSYRTKVLSLLREYNVGCPQVSNSGPFF